jgi:hypothetical protein
VKVLKCGVIEGSCRTREKVPTLQKDGWRFRYRLRASIHFSAPSIVSNLMRAYKNYVTGAVDYTHRTKPYPLNKGKCLMNGNFHISRYTYEGRSLTWRVNVLTLTTPPKSFVSA